MTTTSDELGRTTTDFRPDRRQMQNCLLVCIGWVLKGKSLFNTRHMRRGQPIRMHPASALECRSARSPPLNLPVAGPIDASKSEQLPVQALRRLTDALRPNFPKHSQAAAVTQSNRSGARAPTRTSANARARDTCFCASTCHGRGRGRDHPCFHPGREKQLESGQEKAKRCTMPLRTAARVPVARRFGTPLRHGSTDETKVPSALGMDFGGETDVAIPELVSPPPYLQSRFSRKLVAPNFAEIRPFSDNSRATPWKRRRMSSINLHRRGVERADDVPHDRPHPVSTPHRSHRSTPHRSTRHRSTPHRSTPNCGFKPHRSTPPASRLTSEPPQPGLAAPPRRPPPPPPNAAGRGPRRRATASGWRALMGNPCPDQTRCADAGLRLLPKQFR